MSAEIFRRSIEILLVQAFFIEIDNGFLVGFHLGSVGGIRRTASRYGKYDRQQQRRRKFQHGPISVSTAPEQDRDAFNVLYHATTIYETISSCACRCAGGMSAAKAFPPPYVDAS